MGEFASTGADPTINRSPYWLDLYSRPPAIRRCGDNQPIVTLDEHDSVAEGTKLCGAMNATHWSPPNA